MKIGFVADRYWGRETRLHNLMTALRKDGHALSVLSCPNGRVRKGRTSDGVRFYEHPVPILFSKMWTLDLLRRVYRDASSPWFGRIEEFVRLESPEVLHVNDLPLSWVAGQVAAKHGIPMIVDYHEAWPELTGAMAAFRGPSVPWWRERDEVILFWEEMEREAFRLARRMIVVDEGFVGRLCARGAEAGKLVVVRNTAQTDRLCAVGSSDRGSPWSPRSFTLGYVGTFDIMKDIPGLIRAFAGLPAFGGRAPRLLLVGAGEQERPARELASSLGLSARVVFAGWMELEMIHRAVEACEIGVIACRLHPYTHIGSSNKLYQYMHFGRPVISTPIRNTAAVVRENGVGEVCPMEEEALSEAVAELLEEERWDACARNGRQATMTKYRWSDDAARLRGAYS